MRTSSQGVTSGAKKKASILASVARSARGKAFCKLRRCGRTAAVTASPAIGATVSVPVEIIANLRAIMRSGRCGLGSRQQIAVTDVNDALAHFSRVDSVLANKYSR